MRVYELICFEGSVIKKEGTLQPVMSGYGNAPQSIAEQFVTLLLINKTNNVPSAYKTADKKHREEMDKLKCWERKRSQAWTCLPKGHVSFAGELRLKGAGRCTANIREMMRNTFLSGKGTIIKLMIISPEPRIHIHS